MNEVNRLPDRAAEPAKQPPKQPHILRRLLSHHELATLLVLLHSPIDVMAKPEIPMLQEAGLVEMVSGTQESPRFQLTSEGNAVLRGLGAA